jgi:sterol desaturase/sphingolipid hydroxylase (fatty acid hydroxylase superfamily)
MPLATFLAHYQWQLSLYSGIGILAVVYAGHYLLRLVPAIRAEQDLNASTQRAKMAKPNYAANQAWNRKWGGLFVVIIFAGILPFCLTAQPQAWWTLPLDVVVILMTYDFVYYCTHRFLFHDGGFGPGPLTWMHAIHHRQHNPCRKDSSYIHPLEVAIGLGLFVGTVAALSLVMGRFSVPTLVITWVAFTEINQHNHDLWESDRFPFRYLAYASKMHHHHHARFTGGNFATISLLYDWMFGTLDHGQGFKSKLKSSAERRAAT